jgi:hypothetical protein
MPHNHLLPPSSTSNSTRPEKYEYSSDRAESKSSLGNRVEGEASSPSRPGSRSGLWSSAARLHPSPPSKLPPVASLASVSSSSPQESQARGWNCLPPRTSDSLQVGRDPRPQQNSRQGGPRTPTNRRKQKLTLPLPVKRPAKDRHTHCANHSAAR